MLLTFYLICNKQGGLYLAWLHPDVCPVLPYTTASAHFTKPVTMMQAHHAVTADHSCCSLNSAKLTFHFSLQTHRQAQLPQ